MRPDRRYEALALGVREHKAVEAYSNGFRHVTVPDHDRSAIAFADESGE
jgi:hypothetical protein